MAVDDPAQNTDREIWRREPGDFYSPSIHVTAEGGIGMDVGGRVIVMDIEDWHNLAWADSEARNMFSEGLPPEIIAKANKT